MRDDVRPGRHHFPHERVSEVHDASQQPSLLPFDDALLPFGASMRSGDSGWDMSLLIIVDNRHAAFRMDRPGNPPGHGPEAPRDRRERRQQDLQHALRIAAHDEQRQQQFAHDDERRDHRRHDRQRLGPNAEQARHQNGGSSGDEAEEEPNRNEQQQRIVQIRSERVRPSAALGLEAQR